MPVSLGIALAPVVIQGVTSLVQNAKAKKIAKNNVRPEYKVSQQVIDNNNLAASLAGTGLSDSTRTQAEQSNQRNLSQSLSAILRAGGGANQISDLYANNNDFLMGLASKDAELQRYNISQYLQTNKDLGNENQTAWQVNQYAPYADRAQLAAQLRGNSQANLSGAINGATKALGNYGMSQLYANQNKVDTGVDNYTGRRTNTLDPEQQINVLAPPDDIMSKNFLDKIIQDSYNNENNDLYNQKYGF